MLALAWQLTVTLQIDAIIPGPLASTRAVLELLARGLLFKYTIASLFRVTWGYLLAVTLAIPFGLTLGLHPRAEKTISPLVHIFRPVSPLAWIPFSILWFGLDDRGPIFLIFTAIFLPMTECARSAVKSVSVVQLNAGRNFGLSQWELIVRVIYPAVAPQLVVGLRVSLGVAWLVVVAAEMIAVNSGLGFLIIDARNAGNRYDLVIAGMIVIGIIGLLLDAMILKVERFRQLSWSRGIR
jgi:NitT/TauT family transport system permease protein